MLAPKLTVISFGSQRRELHQRSLGLLEERFHSVEWVESDRPEPMGDWVWCVPPQCVLTLGALLRVQGVMEENAGGIHLFPVLREFREGGAALDAIQKVSDHLPMLRQFSMLMKASAWRALFADKQPYEISELGLSGLEKDILSRSIPVQRHPESVRSEEPALKLDWKQIYLRSRNWLDPMEVVANWQRRGTAIVCFVRTPGLSAVKPQFAREVGKDFAETFYRNSLDAVEGLLEKVKENEPIFPYWAIHEPHAVTHPLWSGLNCLKQGEQTEPQNMGRLYGELLLKYRSVFFLGCDCPQLSASLLTESLEILRKPGFVVGPTSNGHWYLWGGNVALPEHFWDCGAGQEQEFWDDFAKKLSAFGDTRVQKTLTLVQSTEDLGAFTQQTQDPSEYSPRQFEALKKLALLGLQASH